MAKPSWVTLSRTSGSGNNTVSISASAHTGRLVREGTVTVTNQNGTKPTASVKVTQEAKSEFMTFTKPADLTSAAATTVEVTYTSNGRSLYIFMDNPIVGSLPAKTLSINGGAEFEGPEWHDIPIEIPNDPGATEQYTIKAKFNIPANSDAIVRTWIIGGSAGNSFPPQQTITQPAAASTVSVNPTTLELVNAGTAKTVSITSNDDWVLS